MDVGDEELTNRDIPISLEICLERNGNAMVKMISKLRHWAGVSAGILRFPRDVSLLLLIIMISFKSGKWKVPIFKK